MAKIFIRKIEDFTCDHCGASVKGNGYTNHCPACLWAKHVDIQPGDRANPCLGMMKPARIETQKSEYVLYHICTRCGTERRNRTSPNDSFDEILRIQKQFVDAQKK